MRTLAQMVTATAILGLVHPPVARAQSQAHMTRAEAERYVTETYAQFTRATQLEIEASFVPPLDHMSEFNGARYLDVDSCSDQYSDIYSDAASGEESPDINEGIVFWEGILLRRARFDTGLRETLRRYGYPVAAFAPILDARERESLQEAIAHLAGEAREEENRTLTDEEIAAQQSPDVELEAIRQRVAPTLPPFRAITGCGGVESPTFIRANPVGAQVWIISSFRFMHCRALNVDPWSPQACRNWVQVQPQQRHNVVGTFFYIARWADGRRGNGRGTITPNEEQTDQEFIVVPGQMP